MMAASETAMALLGSVRNYLDITWTDAALDEKLLGIIDRGISYIDRIAGRAQNYAEPGPAQGLLMNYCRYERANALEDFAVNYKAELLSLALHEGVAMHGEAQQAGDV